MKSRTMLHRVRHKALLALLLLAGAVAGNPAHAQAEYASDPFDPLVARDAWYYIGQTEKRYGVPTGLLHAMSLVETGQGIRGWFMPWPYTVGVNSPGTQNYTGAAAAQAGLARYRSLGFVRFDMTVDGRKHANATGRQVADKLAGAGEQSHISLKPQPFGRRFNNAVEGEAFAHKMMRMGHNNLDIGLMQINWRVHGKKLGSIRAAFDMHTNVNYAVTYLMQHRQTRDWWASVGRYHSGTPTYANRYISRVWHMYQRVHRLNQA